LNEAALAAAIATRLGGGRAADGSLPPEGAAAVSATTAVIWVDRGDEVLVHLDSVRVKIGDRLLLLSVDLETDQTGRTPLVATYALGGDQDPAGLVAVTDELPRGNGLLASRWGKILQDALWASLLDTATENAQGAGGAAIGISATAGTLRLHTASTPIRLRVGARASGAGAGSGDTGSSRGRQSDGRGEPTHGKPARGKRGRGKTRGGKPGGGKPGRGKAGGASRAGGRRR
jgi:hypothetical protein